ncbi:MAG: hypothetical protein OHK0022_55240 [Roseiflexaceae bacterium]
MRVVEGEVVELLEQGLRLKTSDGALLTVATAGAAPRLAPGAWLRLSGEEDPLRGVFVCASLERLDAKQDQPRRPWWRFWERDTPEQAAPPATQRRASQTDVSEEPRIQHYSFAHRLLPALAWQDPERLREALSGAGCQQLLLRIWRDIGSKLPQRERIEPHGLAAELRSHGAFQIVLITLPPPVAITETYFVAYVFGPHPGAAMPVRYFTLEESFSFIAHHSRTVLGEWTPDNSHHNLGDGPEPELDAFYSRICQEIEGLGVGG